MGCSRGTSNPHRTGHSSIVSRSSFDFYYWFHYCFYDWFYYWFYFGVQRRLLLLLNSLAFSETRVGLLLVGVLVDMVDSELTREYESPTASVSHPLFLPPLYYYFPCFVWDMIWLAHCWGFIRKEGGAFRLFVDRIDSKFARAERVGRQRIERRCRVETREEMQNWKQRKTGSMTCWRTWKWRRKTDSTCWHCRKLRRKKSWAR